MRGVARSVVKVRQLRQLVPVMRKLAEARRSSGRQVWEASSVLEDAAVGEEC